MTGVKVYAQLSIDGVVKHDSELAKTIVEIGRSWWIWFAYIPLLNVVLIYLVGHYALTTLLYPYQNSIIREALDRNNSTKFGEEFCDYLDSLLYTMRLSAGQDIRNEILKSMKSMRKTQSIEGKEVLLSESDIPYEQLTLQDMCNVHDLLNLYIKVNKQVIQEKRAGEAFTRATQLLDDINEKLKEIRLSTAFVQQENIALN